MDEKSSNVDDGKRHYTQFEVRPYKFLELARVYHVNKLTFLKMIAAFRNEIGEIAGHFLSITQVEIIISHLKLPYFVKVEIVSEEVFEHALEEKIKRLPKPQPQISARENLPKKKPKTSLLHKLKKVLKPKKKTSKKK